jgi:hypothetical protein
MDRDPTTPRPLGDKDAPHMSPITPAEDIRTVLYFLGICVGRRDGGLSSSAAAEPPWLWSRCSYD